jgi:hypothetical protein
MRPATPNRDFEQTAREILAEAAEVDRREDELYGDQRGDELPEACRRLEEELDIEHASHAAYDAWRARGVAADGSRRMAPEMVKPHEPVLSEAWSRRVIGHLAIAAVRRWSQLVSGAVVTT